MHGRAPNRRRRVCPATVGAAVAVGVAQRHMTAARLCCREDEGGAAAVGGDGVASVAGQCTGMSLGVGPGPPLQPRLDF